MSKSIDKNVFILFWQFAIKTLNELDIVSNQHLSIEMFLIRLMHLSSVKSKNKVEKVEIDLKSENLVNNKETQLTSKKINQIKNVAQE